MALWADIAEWVGPTPNRVEGGMSEYRGLVIHIMQGSYIGSVAWGKNPNSNVSFHFATQADGHIGQLVDTADMAWTQGNGNGHWISVENEGYSGNALTAGQVEAIARLYARGVREYGWPLQLADSPNGFGLGWHGMGGQAWGGHLDCPGEPIKAQRPAILARAEQILNGDDDMSQEAEIYALNASAITFAMANGADEADCRWAWTGDGHTIGDPFKQPLTAFWKRVNASSGGGPGGGPVDLSDKALSDVRHVVDEQLDQQSLGGADKD